jgi:hypothetical protein
MGKAARLYTKEIRGDQGDRGPPVPISMISPSWQGPLGPRIRQGVWSPGDGRHQEPRQASTVTKVCSFLYLNKLAVIKL